ncbi:hypothetical protein PYCC9005_005303 [Savitreella phatthalungensis]
MDAFAVTYSAHGVSQLLHPSLRDIVDRYTTRYDLISGFYIPSGTPQSLRRSLEAHRGIILANNDQLKPAAIHTQSDAPWSLVRTSSLRPIPGQFEPDTARFVYHFDSAWTGKQAFIYIVDSGGDCNSWFEERGHCTRKRHFDGIHGDMSTNDYTGHGTAVMGACCSSHHGHARGAEFQPIRIYNHHMEGTILSFLDRSDVILQSMRDRHSGLDESSIVLFPSSTNRHNHALDLAFSKLNDAGAVIVTAASNDAVDACLISPAHLDFVITVGGTDIHDKLMQGTGYGRCVDFLAPGDRIRTTGFRMFRSHWTKLSYARPETVWSGTSMAAGIAAGAIATFLHPLRRLTRKREEEHLIHTYSLSLLVKTYLAISTFDLEDILPPPAPNDEMILYAPPSFLRNRHRDGRTRDSSFDRVLDTPGVEPEALSKDRALRDQAAIPRQYSHKLLDAQRNDPNRKLSHMIHRFQNGLDPFDQWPQRNQERTMAIMRAWRHGVAYQTTRKLVQVPFAGQHPFQPFPDSAFPFPHSFTAAQLDLQLSCDPIYNDKELHDSVDRALCELVEEHKRAQASASASAALDVHELTPVADHNNNDPEDLQDPASSPILHRRPVRSHL